MEFSLGPGDESVEVEMSELYCAICKLRVSEKLMAEGKAEFVGKDLVHKTCLEEQILKWGKK